MQKFLRTECIINITNSIVVLKNKQYSCVSDLFDFFDASDWIIMSFGRLGRDMRVISSFQIFSRPWS